MITFNIGDVSSYISDDYEICISGDFNETDLIPVRKKGEINAIVSYQANFLKNGVNL